MTARSRQDVHAGERSPPRRSSSGRLPAAMAGAITSEFHQADSGLGQAAQAVARDTQQPLDGDRVEAGRDLELDELGVRQLAVANAIVGQRRAGSGGLADEHQQLDRHAGPLGELREGEAAERREPLVGGRVEEVERDLAAPHGGAQAVQRDASRRQAVDQPRPAHVTRREASVSVGLEDAQLDQPAQLLEADPGPLGRFGDLVSLHEPYCSGGGPEDDPPAATMAVAFRERVAQFGEVERETGFEPATFCLGSRHSAS